MCNNSPVLPPLSSSFVLAEVSKGKPINFFFCFFFFAYSLDNFTVLCEEYARLTTIILPHFFSFFFHSASVDFLRRDYFSTAKSLLLQHKCLFLRSQLCVHCHGNSLSLILRLRQSTKTIFISIAEQASAIAIPNLIVQRMFKTLGHTFQMIL